MLVPAPVSRPPVPPRRPHRGLPVRAATDARASPGSTRFASAGGSGAAPSRHCAGRPATSDIEHEGERALLAARAVREVADDALLAVDAVLLVARLAGEVKLGGQDRLVRG